MFWKDHFCRLYSNWEDMQKTSCRPKDFIQKASTMEEWECGICFDLSTDLVRCQGPCQKVFCIECVSHTKNVSDRCPNRCSKPFFAQKIAPPPFSFSCPFNPNCTLPILSPEQFKQHNLVCSFTPTQERQGLRLKEEYRCGKEHLLQFFIGKYNEMVSSECAQCGENKLCRSICRKCDQKYCVDCRMPPCSRHSCPLGHPFTLLKDTNLAYLCDVCGMNANIFSSGIYDDKACNFGICQSCISRLPEQSNQQVIRLTNSQEHCSCGSNLIYASTNSLASCSLCQRIKPCPKQCSSCGLSFCLKCKGIDLYEDICESLHPFTQIASSHSVECMRCEKSLSIYHSDAQCGIIICTECRDYFHAVSNDKKRLRAVYCEDGHRLTFVKQTERTCRKCKQTRELQLICTQCEGKDVLYCFQCRPISMHSCYFDHPLTPLPQNSQPAVCSLCCQLQSSLKACLKCKFYVCACCEKPTEAPSLAASLGALLL